MIPKDYLEKVYAGFLGMNVGIRLGAPVEPTIWTYERIKLIYGDIEGYVKEYKNFAADDDVNGPVFFIRALYDDAYDRELEPEDVGRAWLNYTREGIGMFWWGGVGRSTEHTAYLNLKNGIKAPRSGSAEQNGIILAEQIGGQIFIDTWGLVFPNNPSKAAEYAEKAGSVSHDKNGLYGAGFMAACISKAFSTCDINEIINTGLSCIPSDSTYSKVVNSVLDFYKNYPGDFRLCRDYLEKNWGYDKYQGVCHIIPNAGVCVLALVYGQGNFSRTVEIATMCGWDTDCNAGNVGTILGVANGIKGIEDHYRKPINDFIATSSVSGYLNIIDVPTIAKELALLGYRLSGETPPKELKDSYKKAETYFDFEIPGATHGFRISNTNKFRLKGSNEFGYYSKGSIEVLFDRIVSGDSTSVYYKPFYRREDFDDERYKPTFAPKIYSGQNISMKIYLDRWEGGEIRVIPYIRNTYNKEKVRISTHVLEDNSWNDIEFIIPEIDGALIDEVGVIVETSSDINNRGLGRLFIDNFHAYGKSKYSIDFSKQANEFTCITPFSHNHGLWSLENGKMKCISEGQCEAYTGNYFMKNFKIKAQVEPIRGYSHNISFRAKGTQLGYHIGFDGENKISLILNDFGFKRILSLPYKWDLSKEYVFELTVVNEKIEFYIDKNKLIDYSDDTFKNGMFGFSSLDEGETCFGKVEVEEL